MPTSPKAAAFTIENLLSDEDAATLSSIWESFPRYRASSTHRPAPEPERLPQGSLFRRLLPWRRPAKLEAGLAVAGDVLRGKRVFRPELAQRADAARNFVRTGGRAGRTDEGAEQLRARNDYFRETYAVAGQPLVAGVEVLLANRRLADAARTLHGHRIVVPWIFYANILVPGQELGLHTDVPVYRLAPGAKVPLWLRVVMRQSGKFERWRVDVATAVIYLHDCVGGDFAHYPDGPRGEASTIRPHPRSAIVFDAESMLHGVDRVGPGETEAPPVSPGSVLRFRPDDTWELRGSEDADSIPVSSYSTSQVRFSASWKALCFENRSARRRWRDHTDDLRPDQILPILVEDMRTRSSASSAGNLGRLTDRELGLRLIDEYVQFPTVERAPDDPPAGHP